jgi:tryptophanase
MKTIIEPFRIRSIEPIRMSTREEREKALKAADYNLFSLAARDVMIDLLTDSGTGAMSTRQWAALMQGDESYAGSESYYDLRDTVRGMLGFKHVIPVHQGRAAERILFQILAGEDKAIPNNTHFDTTRANIEFRGTSAVDLPVPEGLDPSSPGDFKGNMDIGRLRDFLAENHERVPVGLLTITNNGNGGQPVSMRNIRETAELYRQYNIPFLLDAARFAENAYMIKIREDGYAEADLHDIVREMFSYADGCMVSAKKDGMVNIGGLICLNDDDLSAQARNILILTEGFPTYGGLAGRDMAALAQGLREVLDWDYLLYRHASAQYLADGLERLGVPCVRPTGLHAVYIDARALLPGIPPTELPGQTLCCELYKIGGIRAVEIGTLMFGTTDPETGEARPANLDLVRLTLPRRVYTQSHIDWLLEAFEEIATRKDSLRGYRILEEAPFLRAFTAKLAPIPD